MLGDVVTVFKNTIDDGHDGEEQRQVFVHPAHHMLSKLWKTG